MCAVNKANDNGGRALASWLVGGVLALSAAQVSAATVSTLASFNIYDAVSNAGAPWGRLAQGRDGNIYGITENGGGSGGCGTAYRLDPNGTNKTIFYQFKTSATSAPCAPNGGLTLGADGNLYGTTLFDGVASYGTIFKLTTTGTLTVLHEFTGADGAQPGNGGLTLGADGNLYGTTAYGGSDGLGTVFKVTPAGVFTTLHTFTYAAADGLYPDGGLVQAIDGNFYGVTSGFLPGNVVEGFYRISTSGAFKLIKNVSVGYGSVAPLVQAPDGYFYGVSTEKAFRLSATGSLKVLHDFTSGSGTLGTYPYGGLVLATDGYFYGTTMMGGSSLNSANSLLVCNNGCGTLFRVAVNGTYEVVYSLLSDPNTGWRDGVLPVATQPLQHTNGKIYFTTVYNSTSPSFDSWNAGAVMVADLGLAPFVSTLPSVAKAGQNAGLFGQGFTGMTSTKFNGVNTTFSGTSDTFRTAKVPTGPATGLVTVATPSGTLTSNKTFRVTPVLSSFTPGFGAVGSIVTVAGKSLSQTTKVTIGGKAVTSYTIDSDSQLTLTVPTGAVTGKIVVTTAGGKATSAATYTVTP